MKNFYGKTLLSISLLLASCLSTAQVEGLWVSEKALGMAGATTAYPQDSFIAAFNPAGMVDVGDRFDIGAAVIHYEGKTKIHGNTAPALFRLGQPVNGSFDGFRTANIYPVSFGINKMINCNTSIGFVLYNRNYNKTTYKTNFPLFGTSHLGLEYINETASANVAYRWNCCHAFGLSLNLQAERLKVNGLERLDRTPGFILVPVLGRVPVAGTSHPGHLTNRGYDYSTGWGVTLGYRWTPTPCFSFGFSWQPQTSMRKLDKYKGFLVHGKLDVPAIYTAGIAWSFLPCATVCFDVQHLAWNRIKSLHNPLLHNGSIEALGSSHGPGFGWKSQTYYRLGADYILNDCWTVRAGFRHVNTPIRRTQTAVNVLTLDTVENVATAGFTWAINCCNEISFVAAYGFEHKVKGKHSIPTPPPLFGGEADLRENLWALGLSWGHCF